MPHLFASIDDYTNAVKKDGMRVVDLVEKVFDNIKLLNPKLNCFTRLLIKQALIEAENLDVLIQKGQDPGPLAGVPFGVKDLFDVSGMVTTAGSIVRKNALPVSKDTLVIQRLKAAGAILVGTLNMDEFAYGFVTENEHYGTTLNPHDESRLAGGSSGGSAACVAAGMVPFALGSDTNGSIRVPASLCGVYGLRPTHGNLPVDGTFPFVERLDTVGPFTRSAAESRLVYEVMSGKTESSEKQALKAAKLIGWFEIGADPDFISAIEQISEHLGVTATIDLEFAESGRSAAFVLTASEGGKRHLSALCENPMAFDSATRDRLIAGSILPDSILDLAEKVAHYSVTEVIKVLEEYDILIAPATPSVAPDIEGGMIELNGEFVSARANLGLYTQPLSLAGVPILSLPLKRENKLPLGIQLIAGRGNEEMLFDVAQQLSDAGFVQFTAPLAELEVG